MSGLRGELKTTAAAAATTTTTTTTTPFQRQPLSNLLPKFSPSQILDLSSFEPCQAASDWARPWDRRPVQPFACHSRSSRRRHIWKRPPLRRLATGASVWNAGEKRPCMSRPNESARGTKRRCVDSKNDRDVDQLAVFARFSETKWEAKSGDDEDESPRRKKYVITPVEEYAPHGRNAQTPESETDLPPITLGRVRHTSNLIANSKKPPWLRQKASYHVRLKSQETRLEAPSNLPSDSVLPMDLGSETIKPSIENEMGVVRSSFCFDDFSLPATGNHLETVREEDEDLDVDIDVDRQDTLTPGASFMTDTEDSRSRATTEAMETEEDMDEGSTIRSDTPSSVIIRRDDTVVDSDMATVVDEDVSEHAHTPTPSHGPEAPSAPFDAERILNSAARSDTLSQAPMSISRTEELKTPVKYPPPHETDNASHLDEGLTTHLASDGDNTLPVNYETPCPIARRPPDRQRQLIPPEPRKAEDVVKSEESVQEEENTFDEGNTQDEDITQTEGNTFEEGLTQDVDITQTEENTVEEEIAQDDDITQTEENAREEEVIRDEDHTQEQAHIHEAKHPQEEEKPPEEDTTQEEKTRENQSSQEVSISKIEVSQQDTDSSAGDGDRDNDDNNENGGETKTPSNEHPSSQAQPVVSQDAPQPQRQPSAEAEVSTTDVNSPFEDDNASQDNDAAPSSQVKPDILDDFSGNTQEKKTLIPPSSPPPQELFSDSSSIDAYSGSREPTPEIPYQATHESPSARFSSILANDDDYERFPRGADHQQRISTNHDHDNKPVHSDDDKAEDSIRDSSISPISDGDWEIIDNKEDTGKDSHHDEDDNDEDNGVDYHNYDDGDDGLEGIEVQVSNYSFRDRHDSDAHTESSDDSSNDACDRRSITPRIERYGHVREGAWEDEEGVDIKDVPDENASFKNWTRESSQQTDELFQLGSSPPIYPAQSDDETVDFSDEEKEMEMEQGANSKEDDEGEDDDDGDDDGDEVRLFEGNGDGGTTPEANDFTSDVDVLFDQYPSQGSTDSDSQIADSPKHHPPSPGERYNAETYRLNDDNEHESDDNDNDQDHQNFATAPSISTNAIDRLSVISSPEPVHISPQTDSILAAEEEKESSFVENKPTISSLQRPTRKRSSVSQLERERPPLRRKRRSLISPEDLIVNRPRAKLRLSFPPAADGDDDDDDDDNGDGDGDEGGNYDNNEYDYDQAHFQDQEPNPKHQTLWVPETFKTDTKPDLSAAMLHDATQAHIQGDVSNSTAIGEDSQLSTTSTSTSTSTSELRLPETIRRPVLSADDARILAEFLSQAKTKRASFSNEPMSSRHSFPSSAMTPMARRSRLLYPHKSGSGSGSGSRRNSAAAAAGGRGSEFTVHLPPAKKDSSPLSSQTLLNTQRNQARALNPREVLRRIEQQGGQEAYEEALLQATTRRKAAKRRSSQRRKIVRWAERRIEALERDSELPEKEGEKKRDDIGIEESFSVASHLHPHHHNHDDIKGQHEKRKPGGK